MEELNLNPFFHLPKTIWSRSSAGCSLRSWCDSHISHNCHNKGKGGGWGSETKASICQKWATWLTNACCVCCLLMWEEEGVSISTWMKANKESSMLGRMRPLRLI